MTVDEAKQLIRQDPPVFLAALLELLEWSPEAAPAKPPVKRKGIDFDADEFPGRAELQDLAGRAGLIKKEKT